jgi:hypothetical protein
MGESSNEWKKRAVLFTILVQCLWLDDPCNACMLYLAMREPKITIIRLCVSTNKNCVGLGGCCMCDNAASFLCVRGCLKASLHDPATLVMVSIKTTYALHRLDSLWKQLYAASFCRFLTGVAKRVRFNLVRLIILIQTKIFFYLRCVIAV